MGAMAELGPRQALQTVRVGEEGAGGDGFLGECLLIAASSMGLREASGA